MKSRWNSISIDHFQMKKKKKKKLMNGKTKCLQKLVIPRVLERSSFSGQEAAATMRTENNSTVLVAGCLHQWKKGANNNDTISSATFIGYVLKIKSFHLS